MPIVFGCVVAIGGFIESRSHGENENQEFGSGDAPLSEVGIDERSSEATLSRFSSSKTRLHIIYILVALSFIFVIWEAVSDYIFGKYIQKDEDYKERILNIFSSTETLVLSRIDSLKEILRFKRSSGKDRHRMPAHEINNIYDNLGKVIEKIRGHIEEFYPYKGVKVSLFSIQNDTSQCMAFAPDGAGPSESLLGSSCSFFRHVISEKRDYCYISDIKKCAHYCDVIGGKVQYCIQPGEVPIGSICGLHVWIENTSVNDVITLYSETPNSFNDQSKDGIKQLLTIFANHVSLELYNLELSSMNKKGILRNAFKNI